MEKIKKKLEKVYEEKKGEALSAFDASTGRGLGKVIMTTNKAFGGDTSKYVESLQSLVIVFVWGG